MEKTEKIKIYKTQDVYELNELDQPLKNTKWYDFLGGTKNLRCFLVDDNVKRCEFKEQYQNILDKTLENIYDNQNIIVNQDCSYAMPGFYIVAYNDKNFSTINELDNKSLFRMIFIIKTIRKALLDLFDIQTVKIYHEEKVNKLSIVHFWIVPVHNRIMKNPGIRNKMNEYFNSFKFINERENILLYNEAIKNYFNENHILEKDNILLKKLGEIKWNY